MFRRTIRNFRWKGNNTIDKLYHVMGEEHVEEMLRRDDEWKDRQLLSSTVKYPLIKEDVPVETTRENMKIRMGGAKSEQQVTKMIRREKNQTQIDPIALTTSVPDDTIIMYVRSTWGNTIISFIPKQWETVRRKDDRIILTYTPKDAGYHADAAGGYASAQIMTNEALYHLYQKCLDLKLVQPRERIPLCVKVNGRYRGRGGVFHALKENKHLVRTVDVIDCTLSNADRPATRKIHRQNKLDRLYEKEPNDTKVFKLITLQDNIKGLSEKRQRYRPVYDAADVNFK